MQSLASLLALKLWNRCFYRIKHFKQIVKCRCQVSQFNQKQSSEQPPCKGSPTSSREKSSAARKHCKSNNIILMPEFHILSKSPRTTSVASPRTKGGGSHWRALPAEAQHYSQPWRGSQLEDETSLHIWVTADRSSSLVQQSNTICWAVHTASQHPPSSNSRQMWSAPLGRADRRAWMLCPYQAPPW